jgi:hypothetical protein
VAEQEAYLCIISDRDALRWILKEKRMAFPGNRARAAQRLRPGDALFLYTTRGCFRNPTRDRGRVIGVAQVRSPVKKLDEPVTIGDRRFEFGCQLVIQCLTRRGAGVELSRLVDELEVFPSQSSWSARLRTTLLSLSQRDAELLLEHLQPVIAPIRGAIATYDRRPRERVLTPFAAVKRS